MAIDECRAIRAETAPLSRGAFPCSAAVRCGRRDHSATTSGATSVDAIIATDTWAVATATSGRQVGSDQATMPGTAGAARVMAEAAKPSAACWCSSAAQPAATRPPETAHAAAPSSRPPGS
jgi:hypothetical protein